MFNRQAARAAKTYRKLRPELEVGAEALRAYIQTLLDAEGVNYLTIESRAKSVESFQRKAAREDPDNPGTAKFPNPIDDVADVIGIRVITYLMETVDRACEVIRSAFSPVLEMDKGAENHARGQVGYSSIHFLVKLPADLATEPEFAKVANRTFEIQVRTVVQHAWAEFEHDVRYKVSMPEDLKAEFDHRFIRAASLLELADEEFAVIDGMYRDLILASPPQNAQGGSSVTPINAESLANYLGRRYSSAARPKAAHLDWMVSLLSQVDLATITQLDAALAPVDSEAVKEAMGHKFSPGQIRRLDDDLLAALGQRYIEVPGQTTERGAQRAPLLEHREEKLRAHGLTEAD